MEEVKTDVYVQAVYVHLDCLIYIVDVDAHVLHFDSAEEYLEETPFKTKYITNSLL